MIDQKELEPDGQKAHRVSARLAYLASDRPDIAFACKECSRAVGQATRADFKMSERYRTTLTTHSTCRVGVTAAEQREHRYDRWTFPMPTQLLARKRDARHLEDACASVNTPWQPGSSTQNVVSLCSAEPEYYSMVRFASEAIGLVSTVRELGHEAHVRIWTDAAAAHGLARRSGSGAIRHMETKVLLAEAKREEPGAQDRDDPWYSQSRRLDDEASGWQTFDDVVRLVEHQTHRRSTEFSCEADDRH